MGRPGSAASRWQPPNVVANLTQFVQQRFEISQVQKEKERTKLTRDDYKSAREELNNTAFLAPLDADNTKVAIYYTRQKWERYGNQH